MYYRYFNELMHSVLIKRMSTLSFSIHFYALLLFNLGLKVIDLQRRLFSTIRSV